MTDQFSNSSQPDVAPWWKKKRAKLPTWAWIAIAVVVAAAVAAAGDGDGVEEDADTAQVTVGGPTAVAAPDEVECMEPGDGVKGIAEGITVDEWHMLALDEATDGGYTVIVQARGAQTLTWAVDSDGEQIDGLVASLDTTTAEVSGFPFAEGDSPAADATAQVLATEQFAAISDC